MADEAPAGSARTHPGLRVMRVSRLTAVSEYVRTEMSAGRPCCLCVEARESICRARDAVVDSPGSPPLVGRSVVRLAPSIFIPHHAEPTASQLGFHPRS